MSFHDAFTQAMHQTGKLGRPTDRRGVALDYRDRTRGRRLAGLFGAMPANQGMPLNQAPAPTTSSGMPSIFGPRASGPTTNGLFSTPANGTGLFNTPPGAETPSTDGGPAQLVTPDGTPYTSPPIVGVTNSPPVAQSGAGGGAGAFAAAGALLVAKLLHFF